MARTPSSRDRRDRSRGPADASAGVALTFEYRPPSGAWRAQPGPQADAISLRNVPELLYGGARGGGKSDFLLADFLQDVHQGAAWKGIVLRRSYPQLEELIARSLSMFPLAWPGAEWRAMERTWRMPTGATLRMRSLDRIEDVSNYWGHEYSWVGWDELGTFPTDGPYKQLLGCLRSSVPVESMRVRATAMPGGVGHAWCKDRFVTPAPRGYVLIRDPATRMERIFIPAKVTDNRILLARDPHYLDRLEGVGPAEIVRGWRYGDWSIVAGAYFTEFSIERHVVEPCPLPPHWARFRSFDFGSAAPFACLWFAVSTGELPQFPRGSLVCYRELYGCARDPATGRFVPNKGTRQTAEQIADLIAELEADDLPEDERVFGVADPSIFAESGGASLAQRMAERGVVWNRGDNTRVPEHGHALGWDLVRQRLIGDGETPRLFFFATCLHTIRTLPELQHDISKPNDVDSDGEDHLADCIRYAVAYRVPIRPPPLPKLPRDRYALAELKLRRYQRHGRLAGSGWAA